MVWVGTNIMALYIAIWVGIYGTPHTPHILYIFVHLFGPKTVILGVSGGFDWNPP